jgi:hypothetical protein
MGEATEDSDGTNTDKEAGEGRDAMPTQVYRRLGRVHTEGHSLAHRKELQKKKRIYSVMGSDTNRHQQ